MAGGAPALSRLPGGVAALALVVGVRRQLMHEWGGSAPHRWFLARSRPEGLGPRPKDLRPADPEAGRRVLAGTYDLAGTSLQLGPGGDPWDLPSPSLRFAVALHRFGWMRDLLALGDEGAAEGLRLTLEWGRVFGRWNAFSWRSEVLERRTFNLACAARAICQRASEAETALIALDLARQARHLLFTIDGPVRAAERAAAAAFAGVALAGPAGEALMMRGLARLERALPETVSPDGGHASRSPHAALDLMLDLLTLDEALLQRGVAAPDEMTRAIDRLSGALRFFTLRDGALPAFQGGEAGSKAEVAAARIRNEEEEEERHIPASRNGYHRLDGKTLQVVADAAAPAPGAWSVTACAQPLAIEVLAGAKRLIVNSGWSPDAQGPPALRVVDAASTASLGDLACGEPLRGLAASVLGPRLVGGYEAVEARRHEADGARWLELSHDGWQGRFGLRHERRLYVDIAADELRGEDRFAPLERPQAQTEEATRRFAPFMVRFHIHPDVRVSLARDRKSVLLRADGQDVGWWLRNDAIEVEIEPSLYFEDGRPRRTSQVVLRGQVRLDRGARIRWKLAAAEAWPPPR
jgi:uncharacterized heparinase superfamily protein